MVGIDGFERMGDAVDAFAVFSFTIPGVPLIYSGQEASLNKRLLFFEKDTINWSNTTKQAFYEKLVDLKNDNEALWNGAAGGDFNILETSSEKAFAFSRNKGNNHLVAIFNFSPEEAIINIPSISAGQYTDYFSAEKTEITAPASLTLPAWGYKILIQ